jgi:hypothetical protein
MKREFPATVEEAFEASIEGAYLAEQMAKVRREGRICNVPIERAPVDTFWDLGVNDDMVIWFRQKIGPEHRFIDYYSQLRRGAGALRPRPQGAGRRRTATSTAPTICPTTAIIAGSRTKPRASSQMLKSSA